MGRISISQTNFNGGVIDPSLHPRTSLERRAASVATMQNFIPRVHGGASNRPGTRFLGECKAKTGTIRLVPFQRSASEGLVFEFGAFGGAGYLRLWKNGARVLDADVTISGATQADPVVVTAVAHGYSNGDWVAISSVVGMVDLNEKIYKVASVATDTYELQDVDGNDIDGTGFTAYTSGGVSNRIYEQVTSYNTEAELISLNFTQFNSTTMYFTCVGLALRKQIWVADNNWTTSDVVFGPTLDPPTSPTSGGSGTNYVITAVTEDGEESHQSTTLDGAPASALSWTAPSGTVDQYWIYKEENAGSEVFGWIGQSETLTFTEPVGTIPPDFSKLPPRHRNPLDSTGNYPLTIAAFEQRLLFGANLNNPQKIWGSVLGAPENLNVSEPLQSSDAYSFVFNSTQSNIIKWIANLSDIIIGTEGGEWVMKSGSNSDAITPTSVSIKQQSQWGCAPINPLAISGGLIYITKDLETIRSFDYNFDSNKYIGNDLTILAGFLFEGFSIKRWAFQKTPNSVIWAIRNDGTMLGMTYDKEQEVFSWHTHKTDGDFLNVVSITNNASKDDALFIVERTVNGVVRRYLERLEIGLPRNAIYEQDVKDAFFVDCGLTLEDYTVITNVTAASPAVLTSAAHGKSDGDLVDIDEVFGMAELNGNRYRVANSDTNTFELQNENYTSMIDPKFKWTASGSGTGEFYLTLLAGTDPEISNPVNTYENKAALTAGALGSLSASEWGFGDNDTLGFDTIYVRMADDADPDSKAVGYLTYAAGIDSTDFTAYLSGGKLRTIYTTVSGLGHLEGKSVSVFADGNVVNNLVVTNGSITLPDKSSVVHVGLGYDSILETLDFDTQIQDGIFQDTLRSIGQVLLRLENTRGLFIGPDANHLKELKMRSSEDYNKPTRMFTGDKEVYINSSEKREGRIYIKNSDPIPVNLETIIVRMEYGAG